MHILVVRGVRLGDPCDLSVAFGGTNYGAGLLAEELVFGCGKGDGDIVVEPARGAGREACAEPGVFLQVESTAGLPGEDVGGCVGEEGEIAV